MAWLQWSKAGRLGRDVCAAHGVQLAHLAFSIRETEPPSLLLLRFGVSMGCCQQMLIQPEKQGEGGESLVQLWVGSSEVCVVTVTKANSTSRSRIQVDEDEIGEEGHKQGLVYFSACGE